jgi:hypothetical protein
MGVSVGVEHEFKTSPKERGAPGFGLPVAIGWLPKANIVRSSMDLSFF